MILLNTNECQLSSMLKYILLFLLISGTAQAQEHNNLSISFTPTFNRAQIEPVLLIALTNQGSEPLTNITVNLRTRGLDFNKVAFLNSNNFSAQQLNPEETVYFAYQFQYPNTKDDITVYTNVASDQGRFQVVFTIPAILMLNLPSLPSTTSLWVLLPVAGLAITAAFIIIRKKRE